VANEMSRQEAARVRQALSDAHAKAESVAAQKLIDQFLIDIAERGIAPVPFKATTLDGHVVKTDKTGWHLRQNHSIGIDVDGGYHVLTVPGGWMERLRGVKLTPTDPPLIVGRGGRDGETGELTEFLQWVLDGKVDQS